MSFSKNLKRERTAAGMTQKELAEKMEVYQKDISRWENGDRTPNIDMLRKLCIVLNVSADVLLELQ